jgi:hypothetical protein
MKRFRSPPFVLMYLLIVCCAALLSLVAAAETFHWLLMR